MHLKKNNDFNRHSKISKLFKFLTSLLFINPTLAEYKPINKRNSTVKTTNTFYLYNKLITKSFRTQNKY